MLRPARPDDYDAVVRLIAELGVPDPVPARDEWIARSMPLVTVACGAGDDAVIGYLSWRQYGALAHVMHVSVDPAARGRRVGEKLLLHARDAAKAAGCTRWYLNVKRDNTPALKLYDRCGLAIELESFALTLPWANVPHATVAHRLVDDSDAEDRAIEQLFNVPADRVASFRARGSFRLVTLRGEDDSLLGFAAFSPAFPGAATFCTRSPDLAVSLLEAMRAYADPQFDYVRVTIEGDRALADAVLALGAELMFEILRLSAAIP